MLPSQSTAMVSTWQHATAADVHEACSGHFEVLKSAKSDCCQLQLGSSDLLPKQAFGSLMMSECSASIHEHSDVI